MSTESSKYETLAHLEPSLTFSFCVLTTSSHLLPSQTISSALRTFRTSLQCHLSALAGSRSCKSRYKAGVRVSGDRRRGVSRDSGKLGGKSSGVEVCGSAGRVRKSSRSSSGRDLIASLSEEGKEAISSIVRGSEIGVGDGGRVSEVWATS